MRAPWPMFDVSARPWRRCRPGAGAALTAAALVVAGLAGGCEEVVVSTVGIATVEVAPRAATLAVEEAVQLTASLRDGAGNALGGREVRWSSDAPSVAAVAADGRVTALAPGTARIVAAAEGASDTAIVTVATPPPAAPAAPTDLAATAASSTRIDLGWTDRSGDETEFRVERRSGTGAFTWIATVPAGAVAYSDIGLSPRTGHTYRVHACNAGGCSLYSNEAAATTLATPAITLSDTAVAFAATEGDAEPSIAVVQVGNAGGETLGGLDAMVSHPAGPPTGWLAAELAGPTAPTTLTLRATAGSLPAGTHAATVDVAAAAASNSPRSIAVTFTVLPLPPGPPADLAATAVSPSRIELAWTDTSAAETELVVERRTGAEGDWSAIATLPANTMAHADTGLAAATTYAYRIRACNAGGCSEFSETAEVMTEAAPSIEVAPDSVGFSVVQGDADPAAAEVQITNTGGGTIDGLTVQIAYGEGQPTGWLTASLDATTAPATLKLQAATAGLEPGDHRATVAVASPGASNSPQPVIVTLEVQPPPIPSTPADFKANAVSSSRIDLTWKDTSAYTAYFRIERRSGFLDWPLLAEVPVGTNFYSDTGLGEDTTYRYRIRACNVTGCSAYREVSAKTRDG